MATLEKIRSKSAILFIVIILALLAFILGDFLTSSRSLTGPGNTAAKVAGHKIDINQFQQKVEDARQAYQNQSDQYEQQTGQKAPELDIADIQSRILNEMILEELMNAEIEKLGITVTNNELARAMSRENPLPIIVNLLQQNYGIQATPAQLYDVVTNPTQYQVPPEEAIRLQTIWKSYENDARELLLKAKYANLLGGTLVPNDLDVKSYYDDNATTTKIAYSRKDVTVVTNEDAPITSDDIRSLYNERKNLYSLVEETRPVDYIRISIEPSSEDKLAAQQEVEDALVALKETEGTEAINSNYNFQIKKTTGTAKTVDLDVRNRLDSLTKNNVQLLSSTGNKYRIAKLVSKYNDIDTLTFDMVTIIGDSIVRDSVLNLITSGANLDTLLAAGTIAGKQTDQKIYIPATPGAEILKSLALNKYSIPEELVGMTQQGVEIGQAVRVTQKNNPVPFYDIALITYDVKPSLKTIGDIKSSLKAYTDSNKTAEAFADNAAGAGYTLNQVMVTPSTMKIGDLKNSRAAAKWAMDAKKGQVSPIYGDEQTGAFYVLALKNIYDGEYVPANDPDLNRMLTTTARNRKKGEKLIGDYSGKANSLGEYAKLMDVPVDTAQVTFGRGNVSRIPGAQPLLMAEVANGEKGQLIGPFASDNAVFVVEIIDIEKTPIEFDPINDRMLYENQMGGGKLLQNNLYQILLGRNKIKNNLQQFYRE